MIGVEARFVSIAELAGAPSVAVVIDVMRILTAPTKTSLVPKYIARTATEAATDSAPFRRRAAESRAAAVLAEDGHRGFRGVHADDVARCLELDRFPFAMVAASEDSLMVLRPHAMPAPVAE